MSGIPNTSGSNSPSIVKPGGLLAILGGGQLGRMMAMAARTMGYQIRVMDPEPACPATPNARWPGGASGCRRWPSFDLTLPWRGRVRNWSDPSGRHCLGELLVVKLIVERHWRRQRLGRQGDRLAIAVGG